ncbi:hypothetical protein TNCV_1216011 [Trichonephila clavipes]|nr:hypothetical protein TNCV_1216011 [Trichonephila clavipes]
MAARAPNPSTALAALDGQERRAAQTLMNALKGKITVTMTASTLPDHSDVRAKMDMFSKKMVKHVKVRSCFSTSHFPCNPMSSSVIEYRTSNIKKIHSIPT